MRSDKKTPLKSDKKSSPKIQKMGTLGYNKKSALLEDAITQMNAGKYGRASSALKDLLALDPLNAEARRLFATLHLRLGSLMSARTAFESLAREAMERQDYWLAESLLREYLTAGPRCVPFLEMLGHVYEEKGDVMAAVAEYGKAVEVLLEDPDSDHPNRASELFGKIRSIAPGSPVAFRFAAMFDTITGQILQTPQTAGVDSGGEPVSAPPISESTVASVAAGAMLWEQMEPTPTDGALSEGGGTSIAGESTETKDVPVPLDSIAPATATLEPADASDSAPAMQVADSTSLSEVQRPHDFSSVSGTLPAGQDQILSQGEAPVADSALPPPTVAEDAKPAIAVLTQASSQPITEKPISPLPMPWDQVEDDTPAISPAVASECSETAEVGLAQAAEADLPAPPVADVPTSTITVTGEESRFPIAESKTIPASLSLQQDDDVLPGNPQETDRPATMEAEVVSCVSGETDVPFAVESTSPTIEVLRTSSVHPITEPPLSPASMPWDQIEEMPGASLSMVDSESLAEVKTEVPEPASTSSPVNAGAVADSAAEPVSSFTSSLGLSWEDILAAVTAMQSSPAFPPAQAVPEHETTTDQVKPDGGATTATSHQDSLEPNWRSAEPLVSSTFEGLVDNSPPLSAPMPWEQVEVEEVAILRPEPEPEFGPVAADVVGLAQDSTVVIPVSEETYDPRPVLPPLPIHISVEAVEPVRPVEEPELIVVSEPAPFAESTLDLPGEQSLRLAGSEAGGVSITDESTLAAEALVEAVGAVSAEMSLTSDQLIAEDVKAHSVESIERILSNSPSSVDQPLAVPETQEPTVLATAAPVAEAAVVADQPVLQTEPIAVMSEVVRVAEDVEPASEPDKSSLLGHGPVSLPELEDSHVAMSASIESGASAEQVPHEPASPVLESNPPQSTSAPVAVGSDALDLTSIESVPAVKVDVPATDSEMPAAASADKQEIASAAAPEASAGEGLRILWDDSSSKPIPSASIGTMLTRWLKRPADVPPVEADHPTTVTGESGSPVAPPPIEQQEAAPRLADRPLDRSIDSTLSPAEQYAPRPKPSKPVAGQAWRHISRAITSLIGAGVSTTRSMIVLIVALLSLTMAVLAGCVGVIALTWLILEEQPTPAYRTMTAVPQHTLPDSQKNGYFLLLGFGAAPTQDPVQAGIDRRVEEADRAVTLTCLTGEGHGSGSQQGASAEVAGKWLKSADPAAQMRVESAGVKSWAAQAGVAMGRYRQWLSKPFEDWGYGQPVSPNCGVILYAHRLYVAEGFAQDVEAGVARLETDLTAWRTVFGQAKTMPVKMLAGDALNDDIAVVSGLLLRPELDDRVISRLAKLVRPLDQTEQSIRWPMQSQFVLAAKTLDEALNHDPADARPFYGSVAAVLPLPKQRRFNAYAEYYEAVGKAAAEGRYADLPKPSQFVRTPPYGMADVFLNPIESLVGIEPLPTWETFAGRVVEIDARLRLASLQAWLRRTPTEQNFLTRVAKAGQGLYDPFTGYPMLVNMKKGVFYSVGQDLKDNDAQERFDVVAQIPPTALAGDKRPADPTDRK